METKLLVSIIAIVFALLIIYKFTMSKNDVSDIWEADDSIWTKIKKCCRRNKR